MISDVQVALAPDGGSIVCLYVKYGQRYTLGINKCIGTETAPIYGTSDNDAWQNNWKDNRKIVEDQIAELNSWMTSVKSHIGIESISDHLDSSYEDAIDYTIQMILIIIRDIRTTYERS